MIPKYRVASIFTAPWDDGKFIYILKISVYIKLARSYFTLAPNHHYPNLLQKYGLLHRLLCGQIIRSNICRVCWYLGCLYEVRRRVQAVQQCRDWGAIRWLFRSKCVNSIIVLGIMPTTLQLPTRLQRWLGTVHSTRCYTAWVKIKVALQQVLVGHLVSLSFLAWMMINTLTNTLLALPQDRSPRQ
jgi:hypothetical protein